VSSIGGRSAFGCGLMESACGATPSASIRRRRLPSTPGGVAVVSEGRNRPARCVAGCRQGQRPSRLFPWLSTSAGTRLVADLAGISIHGQSNVHCRQSHIARARTSVMLSFPLLAARKPPPVPAPPAVTAPLASRLRERSLAVPAFVAGFLLPRFPLLVPLDFFVMATSL